jgi:hypothetical protein
MLQTSKDGRTVKDDSHAAAGGHETTAKELRSLGADINLKAADEYGTDYGRTAIKHAGAGGHTETVTQREQQSLGAHVSAAAADKVPYQDGISAVMHAALHPRMAMRTAIRSSCEGR